MAKIYRPTEFELEIIIPTHILVDIQSHIFSSITNVISWNYIREYTATLFFQKPVIHVFFFEKLLNV